MATYTAWPGVSTLGLPVRVQGEFAAETQDLVEPELLLDMGVVGQEVETVVSGLG